MSQNLKVAWDSRSCLYLTMLFWPNRHGGCCTTQIPCFSKCLSPSSFQSVLKGREVIRRGAKWRVGNGESIKLWRDKWLPFLQSPSLQCPLTAKLQNAKVSFLINPSTRQWNTQLLPTLFSQMESDQITKIPLTCTISEDSIFWPYVQSG